MTATREIRYIIHWRRNGLDGVHTIVKAANLVPHVENLTRDGYDVTRVRVLDYVPTRL